MIKNEIKSKNSTRNYGIDLLKIFAMVNIINLHTNIYTTNLKLSPSNSKYKQIYLLEVFSFWPVDAFGLISGIVGFKKYKFANAIHIWFEYCFYSVFFTLYLSSISLSNYVNVIRSFFPVAMYRNWYINAYFLMYLFLPFITNSINSFDKKFYSKIVILFFLLYSFYHTLNMYLKCFPNYDFIIRGYSSLWLLILYIVGGFIGRFYLNKIKIPKAIFMFIYVVTSFFSSEFIFYNSHKKNFPAKLFLEYVSPTTFIQALSLIFFFSDLKINNKHFQKVLIFLNPLNLNVTLIHSRIFRFNIPKTKKFFRYIESLKPKYLFFKIYGISIIIYLICASLDLLRFLLFKAFKIRNLSNYIEKIIF